MSVPFDAARMAQILDAYGASPARWPAAERDAALAWAAAHPDALDEARALDAALDLNTFDTAPSDALRARVLQATPGGGENVLPFRARAPARAWNASALAALAACAVMGVVIGFNASGYGEDVTADADAAFGAAFGIDRGDLGGGG